ncbi:MAG: recombination-associated protein RdgC, partial [Alcaligenaceae bacterium]
MWFKNIKLFRLAPGFQITPEQLSHALAKMAFKASNSLEMQTMGWLPPRENGGLVHTVNGQMLLALRVDKKLLPATVITQVARARAEEIDEQQGYKPGRKQMKEIKERVADELLPKAFNVYRDTRVWIDPANRWVAIDAAAASKADEVLGVLAKCIDPFPVESLYVALSPAAAMTGWLADDEAPSNFTIDQD